MSAQCTRQPVNKIAKHAVVMSIASVVMVIGCEIIVLTLASNSFKIVSWLITVNLEILINRNAHVDTNGCPHKQNVQGFT